MVAPGGANFHFGEPHRTFRAVPDGLTLIDKPVGVGGLIATADIPVGMSNHEVAARFVVVLIHVLAEVRQVVEVRWLGRTDTSSSCLKVRRQLVGRPFVDGSAAGAFVACVLLAVLRLIE